MWLKKLFSLIKSKESISMHTLYRHVSTCTPHTVYFIPIIIDLNYFISMLLSFIPIHTQVNLLGQQFSPAGLIMRSSTPPFYFRGQHVVLWVCLFCKKIINGSITNRYTCEHTYLCNTYRRTGESHFSLCWSWINVGGNCKFSFVSLALCVGK